MESDAFGTGILPGGLRSRAEIKILIAYLLVQSKKPVPRAVLHSAVLSENLVNYFDLCEAERVLEENGTVKLVTHDEEECLEAAPLANALAKEFFRAVPVSVREKCGRSFLKILARHRSENENIAEISGQGGDTVLKLGVRDSGANLLDISLFVGDRSAAEAARENFLNNTAEIYSAIVAMLAGDAELAKDFLKKHYSESLKSADETENKRGESKPKTVLFVCTGNTCRSPMAKVIFEKLAAEKGKSAEYSCFSRGISILPGASASAGAVNAAKAAGLLLENHRAVSLSKEDINWADIIFCMTGDHLAAVERMGAGKKAKLLGNGIGDPFGGGPEEYAFCFSQIRTALEEFFDRQI